jgi:hypothetical protein
LRKERDNFVLGWVVLAQVQHEINLVEVAVTGVDLAPI